MGRGTQHTTHKHTHTQSGRRYTHTHTHTEWSLLTFLVRSRPPHYSTALRGASDPSISARDEHRLGQLTSGFIEVLEGQYRRNPGNYLASGYLV